MKILEVTIESCEFSEAHAYHIGYQGNVETDISEASIAPQFRFKALYVPFAIVKNGHEYLAVTITNKDPVDGVPGASIVAKESLLIHPSKDKKELIMKIPSETEGVKASPRSSNITGVVKFSYRIITLSIIESIRGPAGAVGVSLNCHYVDIAPHDLNVRIKDSEGVTVGTSKITSITPFSFIELKKQFVLSRKLHINVASPLCNIAGDYPITVNHPNTVILNLSTESEKGYVVLTILLLDGGEAHEKKDEEEVVQEATALFHDCVCSIPFRDQGVLYCDFVPNSRISVQDLSIKMDKDDRSIAVSGVETIVDVAPDVPNGPDSGIYILTSSLKQTLAQFSAPGSKTGSIALTGNGYDVESVRQRASIHRDSIFQQGGKSVVHLGLLSIGDPRYVSAGTIDYTKPISVKVVAMSLVPESESALVKKVGSVVATGLLKEVHREYRDHVLILSLSGQLRAIGGSTESLVHPLALSQIEEEADESEDEEKTLENNVVEKFYDASVTVSLVPKANTTFFGPMSHDFHNHNESQRWGKAAESHTITSPGSAEVISEPQTVAQPPVVDDPAAAVPPINCCIPPRCGNGHPMLLITSNTPGVESNLLSDTEYRAGSTLTCDVCGKKQLETHCSFFHCKICKFELCNTCLPARLSDNLSVDVVNETMNRIIDSEITECLGNELITIVTARSPEIVVSKTESVVAEPVVVVENSFVVNSLAESAVSRTMDMCIDDLFDSVYGYSMILHVDEVIDRDNTIVDLALIKAEQVLLDEVIKEALWSVPLTQKHIAQVERSVKDKLHAAFLLQNGAKGHADKALKPSGEDELLSTSKQFPLVLKEEKGVWVPEESKPIDPVHLNSNSLIVNVIRTELLSKQELISTLVQDVNSRDEALKVNGLDIRRLREELILARREVDDKTARIQQLESATTESEQFVVDLLNGSENTPTLSGLKMTPRDKLIKMVTAFARKLQSMDKERHELQNMVSTVQAMRLQYGQVTEKYNELQEAHIQLEKVLRKYQKELRKVDKYKDTIVTQEKVITKLQLLLETASLAPVLESLPSPVPLQLPIPKTSRDVVAPPPVSVRARTPESEQYVDANVNDELQQQVEGLKNTVSRLQGQVGQLELEKQQLSQIVKHLSKEDHDNESENGDSARSDDDDDVCLLGVEALKRIKELEAELTVKDIRITALEDRLLKTAQDSAKEISKLRMLLFELEMNATFGKDDPVETSPSGKGGGGLSNGSPDESMPKQVNRSPREPKSDMDVSFPAIPLKRPSYVEKLDPSPTNEFAVTRQISFRGSSDSRESPESAAPIPTLMRLPTQRFTPNTSGKSVPEGFSIDHSLSMSTAFQSSSGKGGSFSQKNESGKSALQAAALQSLKSSSTFDGVAPVRRYSEVMDMPKTSRLLPDEPTTARISRRYSVNSGQSDYFNGEGPGSPSHFSDYLKTLREMPHVLAQTAKDAMK